MSNFYTPGEIKKLVAFLISGDIRVDHWSKTD